MLHRLPTAATVLSRIPLAASNLALCNRLVKNLIPITVPYNTPNYGKESERLNNHRFVDGHLSPHSNTLTTSARPRLPRLRHKFINGLSQRRDDYVPASLARDPKPVLTEAERKFDNKKGHFKKPREVSLVASFIRLFLRRHQYNLEIPLNDQFHLVEMLKKRLHDVFPAGDWETSLVKALIKRKAVEMCRLPRSRRKFLKLPDKRIEGLSPRRDDYVPTRFARDPRPILTETECELDHKEHLKRPREVSLVADFIRLFLKTHQYNLEIPLSKQFHLVEMLEKRLHVVFPLGDWETSLVKELVQVETIQMRLGIRRKLPMKSPNSTGGAPTQLDIMSRSGNVPAVFLGKPIEGLSQRRDDYYPVGLARDPVPQVGDEDKRRLKSTPERILVADCIRRFLKSPLYDVNHCLRDQYRVVEVLRQKLQAVFPAGDWNFSIVKALLTEKRKWVQKSIQKRKSQFSVRSGSTKHEIRDPASDMSVALLEKPIEGLSQRRDDYYPASLARDPKPPVDGKEKLEPKKPREQLLVSSYIGCFLQSEGYNFNLTPTQQFYLVENLKKKLQVVFPAGDWQSSLVKTLMQRKLNAPQFRILLRRRSKKQTTEGLKSTGNGRTQPAGNTSCMQFDKPIEGLSQKRDDYYPRSLARDPRPQVDDEAKRLCKRTKEAILVSDCIRQFLKTEDFNLAVSLEDQPQVIENLKNKLQVVFPNGDWETSIVKMLLRRKIYTMRRQP